MTSSIKDIDVRSALETLIDEIQYFEHAINTKDQELDYMDKEIHRLKNIIKELEVDLERLELALAEAYLTDEPVGE